MGPGGETMALPGNSYGLGGAFGAGFGNVMSGVMLPPTRFVPSFSPMQLAGDNVFSSSGLSLAQSSDVEERLADGAQVEDNNETLGKQKDYESDSKSSSDNLEGGSGEDNEGGKKRPAKKKRYHRHTLHQIQEMERFFKECPHPDDKQRQELSRELKLTPRQIKFWFQNKRTKLKVHHERQDNGVLRAENEKLKVENFALRDAVRNVTCPSCGGPATLAEMTPEEQQLRIENMRLREEIDRITSMAAKYIGRQVQSMPLPSVAGSSCALDLLPCPLPSIAMAGQQISSGPISLDMPWRPFALTDMEKPLVIELAVASMEELLHVAQAGEPLWVVDPAGTGSEVIQQEAYLRQFPRGIGPTPPGLKSETSRHAGLVIMNAASLVESLMDVNQWAEMFPSIVSRVQTVEVLSTGIAGTYDGAVQLMYAEFHVPSPLVPSRENYFLRYSKRVEHLWVVVDVSIDSLRGSPPSLLRCRKRPSGCVIEEMPSGYSKVTWVEHVEADTRGVHSLFQAYVNGALAFGATRWLCSLQRQCERMATVLANNIPSRDFTAFPSPEGRRSLLKLAERLTNSFCAGVSASTAHTWVTLAGNGADEVRVLVPKSVDDPARPPGIVLSAASSIWLPVPPSKVFQFLRDERLRSEWDILSNSGVVEEIFHVAKGQDPGNCVSLLRINPANASQSNMLILQECCIDESCSMVVYAPVDIAGMSTVLKGGEPESVALLPSGFAILPDGPPTRSAMATSITTLPSAAVVSSGGSLLTVAFQILVDHIPTARLSLESVSTVNKLISNTVARIRKALLCEGA